MGKTRVCCSGDARIAAVNKGPFYLNFCEK